MIASLGMYDRAETAQANDNLWGLIRDRLRAEGHQAPDTLTRGSGAYWPAWEAPDLVFSQTCGFPYRARLHGTVTLIGTPDYGVAECPPGHYCSVFVARTDDDRGPLSAYSGAAFAFNDDLSQSGWAAVKKWRLLPMASQLFTKLKILYWHWVHVHVNCRIYLRMVKKLLVTVKQCLCLKCQNRWWW